MCLSNIDDTGKFLNLMREIETEGSRSPAQIQDDLRASQQIADELYRDAMNADPGEICDALMTAANDVIDVKLRCLMRVASIQLLQMTTLHQHYLERTKQLEGRKQ